MHREHRVILTLMALILVGAPVTGLAVMDGGAPPAEPGPGVWEWRPVVEEWRFLRATGGATAQNATSPMCTHELECDFSKHHAAAARGDRCAWAGRVWLSNGGMPVALRDVTLTVSAILESASGLYLTRFPQTWENGWWWRAEGERVDVTTPVPCDTFHLKMSLNFEGEPLPWGERTSAAQTAEVWLDPGLDPARPAS